MTVLYIFFFSLTGTFLSQITPDNPLHEFHADRTLLSTSAPHPPVASIVEPKYLNLLVHGIGTPAKQTSSLDPAGLKYSVFFLLIRSPFPSSTSLQLSSCCSTPNIQQLDSNSMSLPASVASQVAESAECDHFG